MNDKETINKLTEDIIKLKKQMKKLTKIVSSIESCVGGNIDNLNDNIKIINEKQEYFENTIMSESYFYWTF